MELFAITGGVGMGKSVAARMLHEAGLPLIDTDQLAHDLVQPGQPALEEIKKAFGPRYLDDAGRLRRKELAAEIFSDPAARTKLESILHPRIRNLWLAEAERWKVAGVNRGIVVIPLLFETGAASHFQKTVCVACSEKTQSERLRERGWSAREISQRISAQWPVQRKMDLADYVIWTEGLLEAHREQLERIFG